MLVDSVYRLWKFHADMNGDGKVTISDLWLWTKWLYFYPGDLLIFLVADSAVGKFLDLSEKSYGGTLSSAVSAVAWLIVADLAMRLLYTPEEKRPRTMSEIVDEQARRDAAERAKPWFLRKVFLLVAIPVLIAIAAAAAVLLARK
jgi:hypothetical protein